jgi:hypothetical protein
MFRPAGTTQEVDLLGVDRVASSMRRSVCVLALFVCGFAALLIVGVASARAESFRTRRPEGVKAHELIADNYFGGN